MKRKVKQFIFLYPVKEYFDFEIKWGAYPRKGEQAEEYRKRYASLLNRAIDLRYRGNGFLINYVVFNDRPVSEVISLQSTDRVIKVGKDFEIYTRKPRKKHYSPRPGFILAQLGDVDILRIAGFHLWDCVDKLAKCAHKRGIQTLVDEDLTELFKWQTDPRIYPGFKVEVYQPPKMDNPIIDDPLGKRAKRPWLYKAKKHL